MSSLPATTSTSRFGLQAWRVVTCLLWLLAAFGILQYSVHGWHDVHAASTGMLVWDVAYLASACITLAAATGTLLLRGSARVVLRVVVVLLALWFLVTAIEYGEDLVTFIHHSRMLLAQPDAGAAVHQLAARVRRSFEVSIALKAAAVLVLTWLAWRLGVPSVRAQFPVWPKPKAR